MWFPSNYVEEITNPSSESADTGIMGNLQKGGIDIRGCSVGKLKQNKNS